MSNWIERIHCKLPSVNGGKLTATPAAAAVLFVFVTVGASIRARRGSWPSIIPEEISHSLFTEPPVNIAPPLLRSLRFSGILKVTFDVTTVFVCKSESALMGGALKFGLKFVNKNATGRRTPNEGEVQLGRNGKRGMKHGNSRRCATTTSCQSKVEFCSAAHLRQRSFSCCFRDGCYVIWRAQPSGFALLFTPACRSGRARKKKSSPTPTVTPCSPRRAQHHCMCVSVFVCVWAKGTLSFSFLWSDQPL